MRIIKTIIYSVSLFIFANTNAQDRPKEDLSIVGKELFDLINKNGDDKIVLSEMKAYCNTVVNKRGKAIVPQGRFIAYDVNSDDIITVAEVEAGINWNEANRRIKRLRSLREGIVFTEPVNNKKRRNNNNSYDGGIDDSLLTLEESLNAIPEDDDHVDLDEDISLDDFKSKFINKKAKPNKKNKKNKNKNNKKAKKAQNIDYNERFKKLDLDGNGSVNMSELDKFNDHKKNTKFLFVGYDQDENQKITLEEFSNGINWGLVKKYKKSLK